MVYIIYCRVYLSFKRQQYSSAQFPHGLHHCHRPGSNLQARKTSSKSIKECNPKNNNHLPWNMPSIRDENRRDFLLQSSSFSWFFLWASGLGLGGSGTSETAWRLHGHRLRRRNHWGTGGWFWQKHYQRVKSVGMIFPFPTFPFSEWNVIKTMFQTTTKQLILIDDVITALYRYIKTNIGWYIIVDWCYHPIKWKEHIKT